MNDQLLLKYKNLKFTLELLNLFLKQEKPELIIKFICEHLFELINESKKFDQTFYNEILNLYINYKNEVIKEEWLNSLFPDPFIMYENYYFNFEGFYTAMSCKIKYFYCEPYTPLLENSDVNFNNFLKCNYYYTNHLNCNIGYFLFYKGDTIVIRECKYIAMKKFKEFKIYNYISTESISFVYPIIVSKTKKFDNILNFENSEYKVSYYKDSIMLDFFIEEYKKTVKKYYTQTIEKNLHRLLKLGGYNKTESFNNQEILKLKSQINNELKIL